MAKSKWSQVKGRLLMIEEWSKKGLSESQMCKYLGISLSVFSDFKHRYPQLLEALNRGRESAVAEIENALLKRALGYDFEETRESKRTIDGRVINSTDKTRQHMPADVVACLFLLKNKDRLNLCDNPNERDLAREAFEVDKLKSKPTVEEKSDSISALSVPEEEGHVPNLTRVLHLRHRTRHKY